MTTFLCNICGSHGSYSGTLSREGGFCATCGSTVRMRAAMYALSIGLFGRPFIISEFPRRPKHRGLGLSDWAGYASRLGRVLQYQNTHVDRKPKLDITTVPDHHIGRHDFLLSIDVFEHIRPPVATAFHGAASVLKPGGVLVFSAPYTLESKTIEHFPDLHDYELTTIRGVRCLINKRRDGRLELFQRLIFHGGDDEPLEMRLFCRADIERHLSVAGFKDVTIISEAPQYGIGYDNACSQTFLAFCA